ncbi:putative small integral membrane protein 5 [Scophthalmus maximus]|uniref:Putative small integral membrane protein 5 n=1 Tax=Scophthalmus maximus TaxID=52904 RepID=A0A2U9CM48_SCOMX|nr:putative small integral membrane protein 5 [Scophthalmus maximus]
MDVKEEMMEILEKLSTKLRGLLQASALDLGAFFVIILFVAMLLFMIVLSCIHCFGCVKPKHQASRVQPLQPL